MTVKEFIQLFQKRYVTFFSLIIFFVLLSLGVSLTQPLKYRAKSRLLITQEQNTDSYAIARSNQYMSGLITELIYSGSFLDALKTSDTVFDRNYFNGTYKQNLKEWKKTIFARSSGDSGIIQLEAYHENPEEAKRILEASSALIISGKGPYKFNTQNVSISVIDQAVMSSFPVKPNIPLSFIGSLIFGILFASSYIYVFPESQSEKFINKRRAKKSASRKNKKNAPSFSPVYEVKVKAGKAKQDAKVAVSKTAVVAPMNLPVDKSDEEINFNKSIANNLKTKQNFNFSGNIHNVLGD